MITYGAPPTSVGRFHPEWDEFMHWLYLPVFMPGCDDIRLPEQIAFIAPLIDRIAELESDGAPAYMYVTLRRGWATPANPLNRPGWHSDGFGSKDINYIWSDRWPTRFAVGNFGDISTDHVKSAEQFEEVVRSGTVDVFDGEPNSVYRLDPRVIHATPEVPAPGGPRSFLKVSISPNKYNLKGNSHNHLFDYAWRMWDREELRNDPAWAGGDAGPEA